MKVRRAIFAVLAVLAVAGLIGGTAGMAVGAAAPSTTWYHG
jgi:hypothetical protein